MAGYLIAEIEVTDPAGYEEYRRRVPASIERHGGRYLVRGGATETVEGDWKPRRLVVLEFPSLAQARAFYESEEYQALKAIRVRCSRGSVVLAEGFAA
jgi:uncharacterized protein (DUF1330 family)